MSATVSGPAEASTPIAAPSAEAGWSSARWGTPSARSRFCDGLDLSLARGETVAIVGPSGCGKTTLLELASGLSEPLAGRVSVEGCESVDGRLKRCAYMPQRDLLLPWLTAIDNAALAPVCRASRASGRAKLPRHCSSDSDSVGSSGFGRPSSREVCGSGSRSRARC